MSNLQKKTAELLLESSENLAQTIPGASFEFWQRKDFRLLVDFYNISRVEQDRMFNELQVSLIGLFDLYLTYVITICQPDSKKVITIIKEELIASFLELLSKNGVEKNMYKYGKNLLICA